jgi:aryl-alcohol dehydrogenase-like predicted oxidoreductase
MYSNDELDRLKQNSQSNPLDRRDFMRVLAVAASAAPGLASAAFTGFSLTRNQRAEAAELIVGGLGKLPKVQLGTKMGNMMVTRMCMCQDWHAELLDPAIEMGVNFIHKAGYWKTLPESIKKLPRDSYYTDITVDNTEPGHDPDNYQEAYDQVVSSLDRNGLQYYDIFRAHYGWHNLESFNKGDNASYRAFKKLKAEGKVKYFGVSQHPYPNVANNDNTEKRDKYAELIDAEIASGVVDSMQVWYSYGYPKEAEDAFARASAAGIGMTAMKVYAHGHEKMSGDAARMAELKAGSQVGRALIRQVLTTNRPDGKPIFHTCVSRLGNSDIFEENMAGASPKVALLDGFTQSLV